MEAGGRSERYRPSAVQPFDDVSLIVNSGGIEFLPIGANGALFVTEPSCVRRLDFTLGEDSDGDGLPDKWKLSDIGMIEGTRFIASIDDIHLHLRTYSYSGN